MINFLIKTKEKRRILIIYEGVNIIDIYGPVVDKFLDINTPMKPFETDLNDKLLHIVIQDLCWLLIYDMIPEELISEDLKLHHRSTNENFSMYFAQLNKKIINSKNVFSAKFMELWSYVVCATILSFLLSIFPNSALSNNIEFVTQVEKYINTVMIGISPQNMKEYHKSVLGLIKKEVRNEFPTYIEIKEPEVDSENEILQSNTKNLLQKTSETKGPIICVPKNKKILPRRWTSHDRSGLPIAQSAEVFKKTDSIFSKYNVDRERPLLEICSQEEFYVESQEVPPITPLGITFEDFPKPHLPPDYYNPRDPRVRPVKRVRTFITPKGAPKRRYRIIPEPEETIGKIETMHQYLTDNQIFMI